MEGARGPLWWVEAGAALLSLEASADTMVKDAGCRLLDADEASCHLMIYVHQSDGP